MTSKRILSLLLILLITLSSITLYACNSNEESSKGAPDTTEATLSEEEILLNKATEYVSQMTLDEKICQLIMVSPETLTGEEEVTESSDVLKEAMEKYPVGGIIYFARNLVDADQTKKLIEDCQSFSKTPLFSAVDEEGGIVARCEYKLGTTKFENMYKYKDEGPDVATKNAEQIATDIKQFGFNLDFAPVADVWSNPENEVIGERAYSDNFEEACTLVSAAVTGFKQGGVLCTLKHFPGHGDTAEDSHSALAYAKKSKDEILSQELSTFKAGIEAGADMVMSAHVIAEQIDDTLPATLSPKVIPELLRKGLGYNGIVITDGLDMKAITDNYTVKQIVEGTLVDADVDILLLPANIEEYVTEIKNSDRITEDIITKKAIKVISQKIKNDLIEIE